MQMTTQLNHHIYAPRQYHFTACLVRAEDTREGVMLVSQDTAAKRRRVNAAATTETILDQSSVSYSTIVKLISYNFDFLLIICDLFDSGIVRHTYRTARRPVG
jgi:hypothetical protein